MLSYRSAFFVFGGNPNGTQTATCPSGQNAVGGGVDTSNTAMYVSESYPSGGSPPTAWTATVVANQAGQSMTVWVVCTTASSFG
jgi:hypothetical protein